MIPDTQRLQLVRAFAACDRMGLQRVITAPALLAWIKSRNEQTEWTVESIQPFISESQST